MPRSPRSRRKAAAIPEQGDGILWPGLARNAEGIKAAELRRREELAHALVAGTLDLPSWLAGGS